MRNCIISLAAISSLSGATAWSSRSRGAVVNPPSFVLSIRGGANEYETKFEGVKCSVVEKASVKVRVMTSIFVAFKYLHTHSLSSCTLPTPHNIAIISHVYTSIISD